MNKLLVALFFVLPVAPALAQARGGPAANPPPAILPPGLHVQVVDGTIVVTNAGGSQGFNAGQFGYVPGPSQPPVVVPANPGVQFVPPPSFSGGPPPPSSGGGNPPGAVDCVVR